MIRMIGSALSVLVIVPLLIAIAAMIAIVGSFSMVDSTVTRILADGMPFVGAGIIIGMIVIGTAVAPSAVDRAARIDCTWIFCIGSALVLAFFSGTGALTRMIIENRESHAFITVSASTLLLWAGIIAVVTAVLAFIPLFVASFVWTTWVERLSRRRSGAHI